MINKVKERFIAFANRHSVKRVAFALLGLAAGAVISFLILAIVQYEQFEDSAVDAIITTDFDRSPPIALRIPAINLDTAFEGSLGLNDDRTIEVPDSYEEVGWYQYGPTPGELGPAVVLGHVDSYEGPAVFFSLGQLKAGDAIAIDRADGTTATFTVERLERHEQSGFPTEAVYGDLDHAGLRLITCSGTFDHGRQVYSHNLIVFARLTE